MSAPRRVALICPGALGDSVLAIQAARLWFAPSHVSVYSRLALPDRASTIPQITWTSSERLPLHRLFRAPLEPPESLEPRKPQEPHKPLEPRHDDRWHGLFEAEHVVSFLSGPQSQVAEHFALLAEGVRSRPMLVHVDSAAIESDARHIVAQWTAQLVGSGQLPQSVGAELEAFAAGWSNGGLRLAGISPSVVREPRRVVIHPGSGSPRKNWPRTRFAELANDLANHGCDVRWMEGPVEQDSARSIPEATSLDSRIEQLATVSIDALADALDAARLFVGNDSGPGHLAGLLGTSTLTLFGPTDARVWRPIGPNAEVMCDNGFNASDRLMGRWTIEPCAVRDRVLELLEGNSFERLV